MRILLLGEYSGVHNNLSKALKENGYEVLLVSDGDGYKFFGSDKYIRYKKIESENKIVKKFLNLYYITLSFSGLKGTLQILKYVKTLKKMKGYDVVQLINPIFITEFGSVVNLMVFRYLHKNNKKVFLCALGDDYYWTKHCLNNGFEYSMFDNLSFTTIKNHLGSIIYVYGFLYPFLNKYIVQKSNAIIPGLYDYYASYKRFQNCADIVPIIIASNNDLSLANTPKFPIRIFHGWQTGKAMRKGNHIFDKAIRRLIEKYPDKIDYSVVGGVSYEEYIKTFGGSHIFIDQCYSQDTGVNALLGMKEGKVVFSGFEPVVKEYFGIDYDPIINALPDEKQIFNKLESLILNPSLIPQYASSAKRFIKEFHSSDYVIKNYLEIWKKY